MYASDMYKYTCLGAAIDNMAVCVYVYSCVLCVHAFMWKCTITLSISVKIPRH